MQLPLFFKRRKIKILLIIIGVLVIIQLLLPAIALHYANKSLANMKGYYGHIEDIGISLYRGAYQINDMYLNKLDSATGKQTDFLTVNSIDLSVEWRAIFHRRIVGKLIVNEPKLIFTENKTELGQVKKDTNDFRKLLKTFMPLKVNRFTINDGELHYASHVKTPEVDVALKKIHMVAENLSNVVDSGKLLPSSVRATAEAYGGSVRFDMKLNPLADGATFDLNSEVKNVNLVSLNNFLRAYGNFDVNRGTFGLYTEMASKNNSFKGYVKPIIKDLDVVGPEDKNDGFFHKLYEDLIGAVGVVFRNQKKDQIATKVPLEGNFKDPKTNTLDAIWEVLRNAFIQALIPSVDNQININSVGKAEPEHKNLIQRIFGKKDKDEKSNPKTKSDLKREKQK